MSWLLSLFVKFVVLGSGLCLVRVCWMRLGDVLCIRIGLLECVLGVGLCCLWFVGMRCVMGFCC